MIYMGQSPITKVKTPTKRAQPNGEVCLFLQFSIRKDKHKGHEATEILGHLKVVSIDSNTLLHIKLAIF